jgi:proteasome accessory factor A
VHGLLFGMETELAFAAWKRADGAPANPHRLLEELYRLAHARLISLPEENGPGLFLANGARFYLDRGDHPEICTPECQRPAEVVRWQLACERILAELVAELEKRHPEAQAALFRCNVDYSGNGASWGCHESYQHRKSHAEMAPHLIPHLVTRIVYTGAGGFNNMATPLRFLLSPRVTQLVHEVGADTPERGIYNLRDESLSRGGFNRLHVICGESLCSELSNYLKLGTTALVVRLIDAGVCRGSTLALENSLRAMRRIASDTELRATSELQDGRRLTALQIQAEYLAMVEAHLGADFMPAWAPELCRRWQRVLEQLERGPEAVATSLDWAIKHALFQDRIGRAGARPADLLRANGLGAELCEIDTRFGELSPRALFHALDEAGALTHRVLERGPIADAMHEPPPGARAEARGRAIRALHTERTRYQCRWDGILDLEGRRYLDLGDPFAATAEWRALRPPPSPPRGNGIERQIDRGLDAYNTQDTGRSAAVFEQAARAAGRVRDAEQEALARFWAACARHDAGDLGGADTLIAPVLEAAGEVSASTRIRLWTRHSLIRIEWPAPLAEIERSLERVREACRDAGGGTGHSRLLLNEARVLGARGKTAAAIQKAEQALAESGSDPINFSVGSHLRWLLAFLLRACRFRRALAVLDDWRERIGGAVDSSYAGVSLAAAESQLALRLGRHHEALERAWSALEHSARYRRHRTRLAACIAYLEAAAASRTLEAAGPILEEARTWHDVQIGELRYELLRAKALVELAKGEGATEEAHARVAAAREEAEQLDARLECRRHVGELEERIRGMA